MGPGGPVVRASASHPESPEFCPQPVYKRRCAEKFVLNHRVPQIHWDRRALKICGVQSPVDRQRKVLVLTNIALIFLCVFLHHFPVNLQHNEFYITGQHFYHHPVL